ncbi:MAG: PucR family transcriptional regulator [Ruminococcaceae bacterium]|nr:PucR family transcriptional regulator [Oscillospiraceae bacterium]
MSNRLFQGVIHQMKDTIDKTFGVLDENNIIIACSELGKIGESLDVSFELSAGNECSKADGYTFKSINPSQSNDYIIFVEGDDLIAEKYCSVIAVAFMNIKFYYDEKYDRGNFIKNIILDNILPGDIYLKARELYFNSDVMRTVILIRVSEPGDVSVYDVIQNLFPDKAKDFVININETDIALIKETKPGIEAKDIEKLATSIADTLTGEFYAHATIGVGTTVDNLKDLARSFKEAQAALEVGKVFDTDKTIVCYNSLGIARLIYQLPTTLCESFLREVFKRGSIESLDQETLFTIQKFFENNLNVSETSRKLFVHRNTLVYRLEKIKKITGLDLREFDHAIIFKIALMVNKYLKSNPIKY